MTKQEFLNNFDRDDINVIRVFVRMPNCSKPEIIENPKENFKFKKDYYNNAYDNDLRLKSFNEIKIVGVECLNRKVL